MIMRIIPLFLVVLLFISCKDDKLKQAVVETGDNILDQMSVDIAKNPADPNLYFTRAKYLYNVQSYDQAIRDMQYAITLDSTNADYYHLTSDIFLDYYKSDSALKAMQKVVALYPQRTASLLKLSEVQHILKQYDPSISTVNNILKYDPQNAEAYFMLGLNFREMGATKQAINSFQTAVENDPELIDAWLILGSLYEEKKDLRAIDFYNSAVAVDPSNIQALHSKAYYLQNHGKIEEALSIYDQINQIDMDYKEAHLNKGILYLELKNNERAFEEFNIICSAHPTFHLGFFYRGIVNELNGKIKAAKADYQNAVNLKSDFQRAQDALDQLKEAQ